MRHHALMTAIASSIALAACSVQVAPWQRGYLAKAHMAAETNPIEASLRRHVQVSKEASSGGHIAGGGGCGCN